MRYVFGTLIVSYSLCPSSSHMMMRHHGGGRGMLTDDHCRNVCHK